MLLLFTVNMFNNFSVIKKSGVLCITSKIIFNSIYSNDKVHPTSSTCMKGPHKKATQSPYKEKTKNH